MQSVKQYKSDSTNDLIKGLSILEITLLIAMKRLYDWNCDTFNFEMVCH